MTKRYRQTIDTGPLETRKRVHLALAQTIECGDMDKFMRALSDGEGHGALHWLVARAIPHGHWVDGEPNGLGGQYLSIAEQCFEHNRPEMLLAAVHAQWPEKPDDTIRGPADNLQTLSTRFALGEHARINLAHHAAFEKRPHSQAFIELALALGQDDSSVQMLEDTDFEAGALIRAARMTLSIKRHQTPTGPTPTSRRTNRLV